MGAGGEKMIKTFFRVLERQNLQNQTIYELYTSNNKSKYSRILRTFSNLQKDFEELYTKETIFKAATTEFPSKNPKRTNWPL